MQALWLAFESIAGKGISLFFIFKFLYYTSLIVSAQALPIAVLLSSIMALGNLSENYEFAAVKSASISLLRLLRPLIVLTLVLSVFNFFFLNNVYPYAILKQKNLMWNIKKKKPALALIPGSFNTEIPNYQIKFDEKYGEEQNFLKKVLIYDLSSGRGNKKVITAKTGKIASEEGSKYMTLILYDGYYYEDHYSNVRSVKQIDKMPASSAKFKEYTFNIDVSSFSDDDLSDEKFKNSYNMLSLDQLNDTIPFMKGHYDGYIESKSRSLYNKVLAHELYQKEDTVLKELNPEIYENFDVNGKIGVINSASNLVKGSINNVKAYEKTMKVKRKRLNLYDVEFYNRIAFSLSCLILFFIGAPLGSIIRKGGFGLPMILAICIYVIYFFANTFGRNLAEESSITAIGGSWISTVVMVPFAVFLTKRASKGMSLINISSINRAIRRLENVFVKEIKEEIPQDSHEPVQILEAERQITEKFKPLSDNKLIDIVQNYKQYDYTKGHREVALELLAERGITREELIYTGKFENQKRKDAFRNYRLFTKNSKITFILYSFLILSNIALIIARNNLSLNNVVSVITEVIFLYITIFLSLIYFIKTLISYARLKKALNEKLDALFYLSFSPFGLALFIILYFYTKNQAKEKIDSIR